MRFFAFARPFASGRFTESAANVDKGVEVEGSTNIPMRFHLWGGLGAIALVLVATAALEAADEVIVTAPPRALVESWKLSPFYVQHVDVSGMPVLASAKVSEYAIREAAYLIDRMIGHRPELLQALALNRVRFVIMATDEMTIDIPEHSDLKPASYWNRRARGLGATDVRPAVSCGEENLLDLPGDPYSTENILIHEFAHAIHERGMDRVDPSFDSRLQIAFERAKSSGLWNGTYAMENRQEYWAEAAQSWFDCNRANDAEHGPIDTREKLKSYDRELAKLCDEVFSDRPWRYLKPSKRGLDERSHLNGFDRSAAGRFAWPPMSSPSVAGTSSESRMDIEVLEWTSPDKAPSASPPGKRPATTITFVNHRTRPIAIDWLDFDGNRNSFFELRPGTTKLQNTYAGHVWIISDGSKVLGCIQASERDGRVEIQRD